MSLILKIEIFDNTPAPELVRYARTLLTLGGYDLDAMFGERDIVAPTLPTLSDEKVTVQILSELINEKIKKNVLTKEQLADILREYNVSSIIELNEVDEKILRRIKHQISKIK